MFHFYTPNKHQKTISLEGDIEMEYLFACKVVKLVRVRKDY